MPFYVKVFWYLGPMRVLEPIPHTYQRTTIFNVYTTYTHKLICLILIVYL